MYLEKLLYFWCFVCLNHKKDKKEVILTIYERILSEQKRLDEQIKSLESQLKNFPDGKLYCTRNGDYYKWYQSDGKESVYIKKEDRHKAEQLAVKKYLSLLLEDLKHEKRAIDFYLRHHCSGDGKAIKMLDEKSGYQELLLPFFKPVSQEHLDWMNSPYDKNLKYPEQLTHKTSCGNLVRSKSEAMIEMALHLHRIPFRYECALQLGEIVIYPDFTIRHPETGELYYWEHFGKMDNFSYCKNTYSKLQLYASCGIVQSIQLITTFETREKPLSSEKIENIIEEYFL